MERETAGMEEIATSIQALIQEASDAIGPGLQDFAHVLRERADRLAGTADRLQKALGPDDERVASLRLAASRSEEMGAAAAQAAERHQALPKVGPNEWTVFGRVVESSGEPAVGLRVRVFDRDRKYDDLLGDTETGEQGDFSVIYHQRDFEEAREENPDLYVLVEDASGIERFSSRGAVRFEAGRSEYFEIVLGEEPPRRRGAKRAGAKRARGKRAPSRKTPARRRSR
jgi:hypothetical protein